MPLRDRNDPKWERSLKKNINEAIRVVERVSLVRVDGRRLTLKKLVEDYKGIIPTSDKGSASKDTCQIIEKSLGLPRSVYFYLGRVCPAYGDYAIALHAGATNELPQSWTPFDTGAMFNFFKTRNNLGRAKEYLREALEQVRNRRQDFAFFLAAYFNEPGDYWGEKKPVWPHPEGLYDYQGDADIPQWTIWTWEVRIEEQVDLKGIVVAWSFDKHSYDETLGELKSFDTFQDIFSEAERIKFNEDDVDFCEAMERWVLKECGL